ncbi:MAG: T9SS type A sorting domain-containing protein [Cytophagaceae bacterium]|nr:MAG: T9SS type A sorting domain-containing protein [Cytophagaceae bacterium]
MPDFALASTSTDVTVNPLPVQLTSFAAARAVSGVQVAWATASEKTSAYFDVERSLDGRAFARVARVAAHGTTAQAHAYASLDATAPATQLYYRLRQVDFDGTVAYSPVVSVAATDGAPAEFTLAPNPARERLSFRTAQPTAYTVRNTLGQLVRSGTTAAGPNDLAVSELPAGVYFFELQGDAGRVVRKFVKE